jgi:hypothetical protein
VDSNTQSFLIVLAATVLIGLGVWWLSSHNPLTTLLDFLKHLQLPSLMPQ